MHSFAKYPWFNDVKNVHTTIQDYLRMFNDVAPTSSKCTPRDIGCGYQSYNSIKQHADNVLETLSYKCNGNNVVYTQLRSYIAQKWKNDLMLEWKIKNHLTAKETERLQSIAGSVDRSWNNFKSEFNKIWGSRVFASKSKTSIVRALQKPVSGTVVDVQLKSDSNKYDSRTRHNFTIFYMRECEIVSKGLDKLINSNSWVWIDLFGETIWMQYGGDKAKKGGYYDTIAIAGELFSVKNSMVSLYIPGNVTENNSNLHKCYQLMNYNKIEFWRSLSKNPCIMSLVFYCVDNEQILESRLVHSCVVLIKPTRQVYLDGIYADNKTILKPNIESEKKTECQFALDQFDYEWKLAKSMTKQAANHWRQALQEIQEWENQYNRPKDLMVLSEIERKGHFDKRKRSLVIF